MCLCVYACVCVCAEECPLNSVLDKIRMHKLQALAERAFARMTAQVPIAFVEDLGLHTQATLLHACASIRPYKEMLPTICARFHACRAQKATPLPPPPTQPKPAPSFDFSSCSHIHSHPQHDHIKCCACMHAEGSAPPPPPPPTNPKPAPCFNFSSCNHIHTHP